MSNDLDRIAILGTTGSGKSTLAAQLTAMTGAEHVELDSLYHRPGWGAAPPEEFRARLRELAERPRWIADGNYIASTEAILWPRAQLIVWLDLPLRIVLPRLVRRSVRRIVRGVDLWQGNRETWSALFSRRSILLWALTSHLQHRREVPTKLAAPELQSASIVRLGRPREVEAWLAATRRGR